MSLSFPFFETLLYDAVKRMFDMVHHHVTSSMSNIVSFSIAIAYMTRESPYHLNVGCSNKK